MIRSLILLCLAVACDVDAIGDDWFRFRGPQLDGESTETDWSHAWPSDGPNIAWQANVGVGVSSVVVSAGRLYTIGNSDDVDTIVCLNAETGEPIWKHSFECPLDPNEFAGGPTSTPTVDGDWVFTISRQGDVHALNKSDGSIHWSLNISDKAELRVPGWGYAGAPLVVGSRLILNVGDAGVCLDKATGQILWKSSDKDSGYATPVPISVDGREAVLLGGARSFICVDVGSGKELWRQRWLTTFGCNAADPIIRGLHVFLSSAYNRGSALLKMSADSPEVVWKSKEFQNHLSTSVLAGDLLYGADGEVDRGTRLACVNFLTGEVQWKDDEIPAGNLIAAGDRLIVLTTEGKVVIVRVSPTDHEVLAEHQVIDGTTWTSPVLSNGRLYVRGVEGELVCLDLRQSNPSSR